MTAQLKNPAVIYNGITLSENTDYTVKYSNNVDVGTVKATITGINNYSGTAVKEFKITPIKLDDKKVSVSLENHRLFITVNQLRCRLCCV